MGFCSIILVIFSLSTAAFENPENAPILIDPFDITVSEKSGPVQNITTFYNELTDNRLKRFDNLKIETIASFTLIKLIKDAREKQKKILLNITKIKSNKNGFYFINKDNIGEIWQISEKDIEPNFKEYTASIFKCNYSEAFISFWFVDLSRNWNFFGKEFSHSDLPLAWRAKMDDYLKHPNKKILVSKYIDWHLDGIWQNMPLEIIFQEIPDSKKEIDFMGGFGGQDLLPI